MLIAPTLFNMAKAQRTKRADKRGETERVWRRIYLREWRKHRGWTVEELAERSGVSPGMISLIENRKSAGSPVKLEALADALQITVGELLDVKPDGDGAVYRTWVRDSDRAQVDRIIDAIRPKDS